MSTNVISKGKMVALTGNGAIATGMRQINPEVVAAYPITPSTDIMQQFASFVHDGKADTNLVTVESEHSAMSACIGAAAAGGRVMTATSSQGLALMWEMLYVASGDRLPIVLTDVNRALSSPINIHCDHSDSMGARDTGWIQLYSQNAQEAYDNLLQAVRISEHPDVRLPVMVCLDGFIISHSIENIRLLDDADARSFIGDYIPGPSLLDLENPVTYGAIDLQDYYMEHKKAQAVAMESAKQVILDIGREFGNFTGRSYGFFEAYRLDDAEVAVVVLNSAAGTMKVAVDTMRERGVKVGLLKPRVFRPFPAEEIAAALGHCKAVVVLDRCDSFGAQGGPLLMELRSALYECAKPPRVFGKVFGLGGRDFTMDDAIKVLEEVKETADTGKARLVKEYITVR